MSRVPPFQPTSSNIAITPNFSAVPTSTGMAQGDMVFWKSGDYQPFSSQVSTATFPLSATAPIIFGVTGGNGGTINSNLTTTAPSGGNSSARNVAKLTNGNIAVAGMNTSGVAYFTIYDTSFSTVVSRVTLPATYTNGSQNGVGITALTGGGFVIFFHDSSGYFCYAVYTNTGTVTTALTRNTNVSANTAYTVAALSGGGFVAASGDLNTYQMVYIIFNSVGTQTFINTTAGSIAANSTTAAVVANNNDTFFIVWLQGSNTYAWLQRSSANASLGTGTFSCTSVSGPATCTATLLNNGTTIAVAYVSTSSNTYGIRQYNSSTYSMGAETTYSAPYSSQAIDSMYAKTLASGNVFLYITQPYCSFYAMFNSSMVPIIAPGQTATSVAYKSLSTNYSNTGSKCYASPNVSAIEIGTSLYVFYSVNRALGDGNQMYTVVDQASYNPTANVGISVSAGNIVAAVGAYDPASLTPAAVTYYPASTTGQLYSTSSIGFGGAQLVNGGFTTYNYDICSLSTGGFAIAYRDDSSYVVYAKVYNSAGTNLATVTIGTSASSSQYNNVKVTPLANGKFVVAYMDGSSSMTCAVVSASYAVTNTTSIANVTNNSGISTNYIALGSLSNDRFVAAWRTTLGGNYYYFNVYDSNCTLLQSVTTTTGYDPHAVCGLPGGGFAILLYGYFVYYQETTTNVFSAICTTGFSQSGSVGRMSVTPRGQLLIYSAYNPSPGSSQTIYRVALRDRSNSGNLQDISWSDATSGQGPVLGLETASGTFVRINSNTTNTTVYALAASGSSSVVQPQSATAAYVTQVSSDAFAMLWRSANTGNYLYFNFISLPTTLTATITAGVTPSSSVSLVTGTYRFAGVAANTVAANGTGVVQTNGMAKLNSNYSTAVPGQTFNARDNGIPGVSGTINGRNMQLYGIAITGTT